MIKKAFVMQIAPDAHQEYQRRHDEIWPELVLTLKNMAHITILFS